MFVSKRVEGSKGHFIILCNSASLLIECLECLKRSSARMPWVPECPNAFQVPESPNALRARVSQAFECPSAL